ncbi:MAG: 1,4-alpha-glucan branching protein domain-containing protein [Elusimicrobiales bacterium]
MSSKINHIFILHAHLPYINHINSNYIEENWYFENVVESYIPILGMIERLSNDGINPKLTVSLSPTLCSMMENEILEKKLKRYIELRLKLIESETEINEDERIIALLDFYHKKYLEALEFLNKYSGDLITPFKLYQNQGLIEVITTPATYPIIPLTLNRETIDAQITLASNDYKERFSKDLNGIFLSECAYDSRVEPYLKKNSIKYFFVDENAVDKTKNSPYNSYKTDNGITFFVLDYLTSERIFGEYSYLSNPLYRDFYRDIGYERDMDYLKKFTLSDQRIPTGIKYHKITDINKPLKDKEVYEIEPAFNQADTDSKDFIEDMIKRFENYQGDPVSVSCFNMELFGHRWFEGVAFLESFFRNIRAQRYPVQMYTPSEYISNNSTPYILRPSISSWSDNGFFDKWLNDKNDFIYPYLYEVTRKYIRTVNRFINSSISGDVDKALKQLTREILLMQSSDWAVLINYDTHKDYAIFRLKTHYENALKIINDLNSGSLDLDFLKRIEQENGVFHSLDWKSFATKSSF